MYRVFCMWAQALQIRPLHCTSKETEASVNNQVRVWINFFKILIKKTLKNLRFSFLHPSSSLYLQREI